MEKPSYTPQNYSTLSPAIAFEKASEAIEWYCKVFGCAVTARMDEESGRVAHAELRFGESIIYVSDHYPDYNATPQTLGGTTVVLNLIVPDVDATFQLALDAGARELTAPEDQFYGFRSGRLIDPFGHKWILSTEVEKMSEEEMKMRFEGS